MSSDRDGGRVAVGMVGTGRGKVFFFFFLHKNNTCTICVLKKKSLLSVYVWCMSVRVGANVGA